MEMEFGARLKEALPTGTLRRVPTRTQFFDVKPEGLSKGAKILIKRVFDIIAASLGLILLLPLLLCTATVIWLTDRGPVLFWQDRIGRDGRLFRLCKFRTMHNGQNDPAGRNPTLVNDPRVTPVGRILRRRSIDELPQLWNVVRGDMSLVGPRAHVPEMLVCGDLYDRVVDFYHLRHRMRPGITGLAQVRGFRGPVLDMDHAKGRIEADLEYVRSFSLYADLKIMLRTIWIECAQGSGV